MNRKFKWSDDQIALEALKFETKANFKKYGRCFFEAAKKRDILDLVCSHMKPNTYLDFIGMLPMPPSHKYFKFHWAQHADENGEF